MKLKSFIKKQNPIKVIVLVAVVLYVIFSSGFIDDAKNLIRPLNYPKGVPGKGFVTINYNNLKINDNGTIEYEGETFYEEDIDKATKEIATSSSISKVKKQSILQKIILIYLKF